MRRGIVSWDRSTRCLFNRLHARLPPLKPPRACRNELVVKPDGSGRAERGAGGRDGTGVSHEATAVADHVRLGEAAVCLACITGTAISCASSHETDID